MNERHRLIAVLLDRHEVTSQQQLVEPASQKGSRHAGDGVARPRSAWRRARTPQRPHGLRADRAGGPGRAGGAAAPGDAAVRSVESSGNICVLRTGPAQACRRPRLRPGRPGRGVRHGGGRRHDHAGRPRAVSAPTSQTCAARSREGGACLRRRPSRACLPRPSPREPPPGGGPLWAGRLAGGLHPTVLAFSASLDVDRRLLPYDVRASRAHVRMLRAPGHRARRGRRGDRRGPRGRGGGAGRERRGRALADRAPARGAAGRGRQARARRALPQRPGRDGVPPLGGRRGRRPRAPRRRPAGRAGGAGAGRRRPACCRGSPTCSGRSRSPWGTICWRTRGRSSATSSGCGRPVGRPPRAARWGRVRWPGRAFHSTPRVSRGLLTSSRASATPWTPSPTATSPATWRTRAALGLVHLSRLGEELVLWTSRASSPGRSSTTPSRRARA